MDKFRPHAPPGQLTFQLAAGEPGHKPQRRGLHAQLVQHTGDVDPLAARLNLRLPGAVSPAHRQLLHPHHVIQGRVEGNRIHHPALPFLSRQARPECPGPDGCCLFSISLFETSANARSIKTYGMHPQPHQGRGRFQSCVSPLNGCGTALFDDFLRFHGDRQKST